MKSIRKFLSKKSIGLILVCTFCFSSIVAYGTKTCRTVTVTTTICDVGPGGALINCKTRITTTTTCIETAVVKSINKTGGTPDERVIPVSIDVSFLLATSNERVFLEEPVFFAVDDINFMIPKGEHRRAGNTLHAMAIIVD